MPARSLPLAAKEILTTTPSLSRSNGLFKVELIRRYGPWRAIDDLELATLEYLDWFNHRRLHTACDDRPPAEYEAIHYCQQHRPLTAGEPSSRVSTKPGAVHPGCPGLRSGHPGP